MSINNLNTYTTPSVSIASMLINGLNTNFRIDTNGKKKRKSTSLGTTYNGSVYRDAGGNVVKRKHLADHYGVSCRHVYDTFKKFNGDYKKALPVIAACSETDRPSMKYKDRSGDPVSLVRIAVREKMSQLKVSKHFTEAGFNYELAYRSIDAAKGDKK